MVWIGVGYGLAALLSVVSSAAAITATPTTIRVATPTPVVCDGVVYSHPALEFDLSVEPSHPVVGDAVTVTVTIRNINGGFAGDPHVSLFSSAPILSGDVSARPFDWAPATFDLEAAQLGGALLRAILTYEARTGCCDSCVTPGEQMSPSFTLSVEEAPLPDLVPSHVQVVPVSLPACVTNLADYIERNPLPASVCLRNAGGAAAGPFVVAKDGQTVTLDALAAGVSTCVSGFLQWTDVATAQIRLDTEGQVLERREDNNETLSNVVLPPLPPVCGTPTLTPIPITPSETACPGDCDANGLVRVDELVRAVRMALADDSVDGCETLDGDHNGRVTVNELVDAVRAALHGCEPAPQSSPTRAATHDTATPTPTPTASGADAVLLMQQIFNRIAPDVCRTGGTPGGMVSVEAIARGAALRCESFTGHRGTVTMQGFATAREALQAFGDGEPDAVTVVFGGGLLRVRSWTPSCCHSGLSQKWGWVSGCWVAAGDAFDDTHFLLAPQPRAVVEEVLQSPGAEDLLSSCVTE